MTSPIRILVKARILIDKKFCMFHDPRWPDCGVARRADGVPTAPHNKPAVLFTPTGAVARALFDMTGFDWVTQHDLFAMAMMPIWKRTTSNQTAFLRICDQWCKERILELFDEVIRP